MSSNLCIFCNKECKNSDSRPYPNSKSKDRIHNKCKIKKTLADKKQPDSEKVVSTSDEAFGKPAETPTTESFSLVDRAAQEEIDLKKAINERKINKLLEGSTTKKQKIDKNPTGQFFFDLKAGIAKPHEKKRYLHHRNLSEIVARYDDNGFQDEAVGRAYDHTGKDLNTLGDSDDDNESDLHNNEKKTRSEPTVRSESHSRKRGRDDDEVRDRVEKRQSKTRVDEHNPCWFCLSSPQVEKHLILAIGDHCYLTLAKGGLTDDHFLLLPIDHVESLNSDRNSKELLEELERFKLSLINYFGSLSKGVVFFERNFRSVHWQLQVVPVPLDIVDTIEKDIKVESTKHFKNSQYLDIPDNCLLRDIIPPDAPYFYWQLEPNGSRFVTQLQVKGSFFPIQFGRLVLASPSILNCTHKIDWKMCSKTKEDYVELVHKTKEAYKDFDITRLQQNLPQETPFYLFQ